jgi:C-terminal peptidase prc
MDMRCAGFRTRLAVGVLFGVICGGATSSGRGAERVEAQRGSGVPASDSREAFARRVLSLTDVVLERHIDPPTRQEMILGGCRALLAASKKSPIPDLSRRVSDLRSADELSNLLDEIWPQPSQNQAAKAGDSAAKGGSSEKLKKAFIGGLLSTIPGHPHIVSVKEARAETQIQANRYVGLGIALSWDEKQPYPQIQKLIPGGSAELGGMQVGDLIEAIDQAPTVKGSLTLRDVVEKLRGGEGTKVTLRLGHPDSKDVRTITFVRIPTMFRNVSEIKRPAKYGDSPRIGLLKIDSVTASTAQELRAWEVKLLSAGAQAVVLDLRNAHDVGPESYHSAVLLADSLLDGKPIGKLRTRERVQEFTADREELFRDMPLAILVDKQTSGAAEWVAAALQDVDPPALKRGRRAVIVGKQTGGANLVTSAIELPGGDGILMLATAAWVRPTADGQSNRPSDADIEDMESTIRGWRVTPNEIVDDGPTVATRVVNVPELLVETIANLARQHAATAQAKNSSRQPAKAEVAGPDDAMDFAIAVLKQQLNAAPHPAK